MLNGKIHMMCGILNSVFNEITVKKTVFFIRTTPIKQRLKLTLIWNSILNYIDRKSTRLNSSHVKISYAVFCLKKKKEKSNSDVQTYPVEHIDRTDHRHSEPALDGT